MKKSFDKYLLRLLLLIACLGVFLGIRQMNEPLYQWEVIKIFEHEVVSLAFISPLKGWVSEVVIEKGEKRKMWEKYKTGVNRIHLTEDNGDTWKVIYESPGSLIEQLQYTNGRLLGIKSVYQEGQPRPHFMLYESVDEGIHWEKLCELPVPYAIQGFQFLDEHKGYAWTLNKIFFTSTRGQQWELLVSGVDNPYSKTRTSHIGPGYFIYFITKNDKKIIGINPWEGKEVNFILPDHFAPQDILAEPSQPTIYVIGKTSADEWQLLGYEKSQIVSKEFIPIKESKFAIEAWVYGKDILNLVGSTLSFFKPYYFYVRTQKGWQQESLSGKKNFEHFTYFGNHAWAIRIALLQGNRELLRRKEP